ncbi:hypothetical protein PSTG_14269 [Puccinia striiformis f. sp. tritici PST-78]|uniref:Tethering factor for nuclear proteasome STS1 n=1 Tax=Puccinia striiformis f. sp. tritici PST-78 TaxID=1165861 RepID=A0A0L0UZW4_9BASI|nr:hypothetical protein PSTG_14269 [Puccinia striiformis f. sp. tritici PST-78]
MPSTHIIPRILRRQLISQPNPSNPESFILPIRKLLIEFNQQRGTQSGLRTFLSLSSPPPSSSKNPSLYQFVKDFPFVEFVVRPTGGSGILKAFYLNNNRIKTIPVDGLDPNQIQNKIQLLLESSGQKLNTYTRKNSISVSSENAQNPTRDKKIAESVKLLSRKLPVAHDSRSQPVHFPLGFRTGELAYHTGRSLIVTDVTKRSTTAVNPILATMAHQVPFRQPAITVPLNWSFAAGTQQQPQPPSSSSSLSQSILKQETRTRKRSASDEIEIHDHQILKPCSALPKRTKRSINTNHPSIEPEHQIDLGTALVSLTKNELIGILQGLIQQKPELKQTVKNLLPPPSLESIINKVNEVEKLLIESIPNKRMNREEYIWNRVRVPLNTYVNDCLSSLEISNKSIENRCASKPTSDGGIKSPELSVIYGAVSDQLSLLSYLSHSISKIESLLPNLSTHQPSSSSSSSSTRPSHEHQETGHDLNSNVSYPFQSILIPSLFQNWKTFIESIHKLIFIDRMIISESLIRKWFSLLDGLSSHPHNPEHLDSNNHIVQHLMMAVRDEALSRFGTIVGLKR